MHFECQNEFWLYVFDFNEIFKGTQKATTKIYKGATPHLGVKRPHIFTEKPYGLENLDFGF
jgi:hypothetical protein